MKIILNFRLLDWTRPRIVSGFEIFSMKILQIAFKIIFLKQVNILVNEHHCHTYGTWAYQYTKYGRNHIFGLSTRF